MALAICLCAQTAFAGESSPMEGVSLTVYNGDLAVVRERRSFDLVPGTQQLLVKDVSALLEPETVHLQIAGGPPLRLLEQNFDFDLVDSRKLLEKFVGQTVWLVSVDGTSAAALLLSAGSNLILEIDGQIVIDPPGNIALTADASVDLQPRPTLNWLVESPAGGHAQAELSYLSGGLSWDADYILQLAADDASCSFDGWVTLTNNSGTTFQDAQLKLVAGHVNREPKPKRRSDARDTPPESILVLGSDGGGFEEEVLFEYHLYDLQNPTTIRNSQQKQIKLLDASNVPIRKRYKLDLPYSEDVAVVVEFVNDTDGGLGIPLPAGSVRILKADRHGQPQYLNQAFLSDTPRQEKVQLEVGIAPDIVCKVTQTKDVQVKEGFRQAYEVQLANLKPDPVVVNVDHYFDGPWCVTHSSLPYEKLSQRAIEFAVPLSPGEAAKLTYEYVWDYE